MSDKPGNSKSLTGIVPSLDNDIIALSHRPFATGRSSDVVAGRSSGLSISNCKLISAADTCPNRQRFLFVRDGAWFIPGANHCSHGSVGSDDVNGVVPKQWIALVRRAKQDGPEGIQQPEWTALCR